MSTGVVVTGLGVLSPGGEGTEALWRVCANGGAEFRTVEHFDVSRTGAQIAGFVPTGDEAPAVGSPGRLPYLLDRAIRGAVADAAARTGSDGTPIALVVGTTDSGDCPSSAAWRAWRDGEADSPRSAWAPHDPEHAWAGPVLQVGNASAAGATALGVGADLLRDGIAKKVVVCGADTITETAYQGLASLRTLSPRGCRPFSSRRSGIRISECAAALVLEPGPASGAYATLRGWGSSNEASQAARPDVEGIANAVRRALHAAGIESGEIGYVNAHAAGTRHGDVAELAALQDVLGDHLARVPVVSTKAALGHCQGAAGAVEAMVTVLTLARGEVLSTLELDDRDPQWDHLNFGDRNAAPPTVGMSISCGLGGTNVAVVFDRAA